MHLASVGYNMSVDYFNYRTTDPAAAKWSDGSADITICVTELDLDRPLKR